MRIVIETIKHENQRYPTVGDWLYDYTYFCNTCSQSLITPHIEDVKCVRCKTSMCLINTTLSIRVSELGDWRREALVAVHELVEVLLCKHDGVEQASIDKFDIAFEEKRAADLDTANPDEQKLLLMLEPGDDPGAPYRKQHSFASGIERLLAAALDVEWMPYVEQVENL
ncbi:MAG TPA: hypothetical protein VFG51_02235 [Candidatus Saccharimonadia bacterium]|nr:hypothetical protein [Candidatus Saccharimonadia bacterium]